MTKSQAMTPTSHLYSGFRYAGALASIKEQRHIQGRLLARLPMERLLVIGIAFGEEANVLVSHQPQRRERLRVTAIDLVDVGAQVNVQPHLLRLPRPVEFHRLDLLNASCLDDYGTFDVVQCGFVAHDIPPLLKDRAVLSLANAVGWNGLILISDIFVRSQRNPAEVAAIYDGFIEEAKAALRARRLSREAFDELVGDGDRRGLAASRRDAMAGDRDFFEEPHALIARAQRANLTLIDAVPNPQNASLFVFLFARRAASSFEHAVSEFGP